MRRTLTVALVAVLALAACKKETPAYENNSYDWGPDTGGRYQGIGIYAINELWEQLVQKEPSKDAPPKDPRAAVLADDTQIIVTVDSRTGEVRQCGNYSGHCISANPWKAEASPSPAALTKHAADLARERDEAAQKEEAQQKQALRRLEAQARAATARKQGAASQAVPSQLQDGNSATDVSNAR